MLEQAEAIDAAEDAEYGPENRGDELPAELGRREERLRRIREAKRALEERARAEAEAEGKDQEEQAKVKPEAQMQYNFTDPESRIMKGPDGFLQGYNASTHPRKIERAAFDVSRTRSYRAGKAWKWRNQK